MKIDTIDLSDISLIELPFTYEGINYVLVEASCDTAAQYRNKLLASALLNQKGDPHGAKGLSEIEHLLVSLTVFVVGPDSRTPVNPEVVKKWPTRMVSRLFDTAKKISELSNDDDDTDKDKKGDQGANPTQSS